MRSTDKSENFKSQIRGKWRDLTDEDLDEITSDVTRLKEILKERFSLADDEAEIEAQRFTDGFDSSTAVAHGEWNDPGAESTHEMPHPEEELIRKDKDNGRYGSADEVPGRT